MTLPTGIFVPTLCFFQPTASQQLDLATIGSHAVHLAKAGVAGLTVHGTTGEPALLSREERRAVLTTTRKALDDAGFGALPIVAGCGVSSTWETIELCIEAHSLGANYALVVAPGYYRGLMSDAVLEQYFTEVADASPLPIMLYNFPGISNGIDLDVGLIGRLAEHPNIVGIKLSCGSVGKAACLTALFPPDQFAVYGGLADTILHGLSGSSTLGAVSGLANVTPRACVRVVELFKAGKADEARKLQGAVSLAGRVELKGGIPGMRYAVERYLGYGGVSRRPLPPPSEQLKQSVEEWVGPLWEIEQSLA